jgi:hypothetical protein
VAQHAWTPADHLQPTVPIITPFTWYARNTSIGRRRSQSSMTPSHGPTADFQDPAIISWIIAVRAALENPIGFDKPHAILKIPKTGIQ